MANIWKYFGLICAIIKEGVIAYEVCRQIQGVTVTYCDDGFQCCENKTRCCNEEVWNPLGIAALVIGCIIGVAFVVVAVILCIKRSNGYKSGEQCDGTATQQIEMVHSQELSFPPPYEEYLGPAFFESELPTYTRKPPPYESTNSDTGYTSGLWEDASGQNNATVDSRCTSGSQNEATCKTDESYVDSTISTAKPNEEQTNSKENVDGISNEGFQTNSESRLQDGLRLQDGPERPKTLAIKQANEISNTKTHISVQIERCDEQSNPVCINNNMNSTIDTATEST